MGFRPGRRTGGGRRCCWCSSPRRCSATPWRRGCAAGGAGPPSASRFVSSPRPPSGTASASTSPGVNGQLRPGLPVPLSFVVCALLVFIAWAALRPPAPKCRRLAAAAVLVVTVGGLRAAVPGRPAGLLRRVDYLRPCRPRSSSAPRSTGRHSSTSLADRCDRRPSCTRTAAKRLVSGGRGRQRYNETSMMRSMADLARRTRRRRSWTQPASAPARPSRHRTLLRRGRVDAHPRRERVLPPAARQARLPARRVQRGHGAVARAPIPQTAGLVVREIPAFWVYYLEAVFR